MKKSDKIIPDRNIKLRSTSQQHPVKYTLLSVVCHVGSYRNGHYIAYVVHGNDIVKCSDEQIEKSTIDQPEIYQQCYMLTYDRVDVTDSSQKVTIQRKEMSKITEVSLPKRESLAIPTSTVLQPLANKSNFSSFSLQEHHYLGILNCLKLCSSVRHAMEYFSVKKTPRNAAKKKFLEDFINSHITPKLLMDKSFKDLTIPSALEHIIEDICCDAGSDISFIDIQACFGLEIMQMRCAHKMYSSPSYINICRVEDLTSLAILDAARCHVLQQNNVACVCNRSVTITCLPYTLILNLNGPLDSDLLLLDINVSDLFRNVIPKMEVVYRIHSLISDQLDGTILTLMRGKKDLEWMVILKMN
jgi:hypothetical protein